MYITHIKEILKTTSLFLNQTLLLILAYELKTFDSCIEFLIAICFPFRLCLCRHIKLYRKENTFVTFCMKCNCMTTSLFSKHSLNCELYSLALFYVLGIA